MGIHALVGLGSSTHWDAPLVWQPVGVLGALLLAASPLYVYSSLQTLSDLRPWCG